MINTLQKKIYILEKENQQLKLELENRKEACIKCCQARAKKDKELR